MESRIQVNNNVAIKVENLSKCYQIYDRQQDIFGGCVFNDGNEAKKAKGGDIDLLVLSKTINLMAKLEVLSKLHHLLCERKIDIAVYPDDTHPFPRMGKCVYECFCARTKEEIDGQFDNIVSFTDIGQFIEQPVKTYSSRMMVRLVFAVWMPVICR